MLPYAPAGRGMANRVLKPQETALLGPGARRGVRVVPVMITAGSEAHEGFEGWRVPKRDLVGVVQVLLQHRRLRIAPRLPEAETLLAEMQSQRIHMAIVVDEYGGVAGVGTLGEARGRGAARSAGDLE